MAFTNAQLQAIKNAILADPVLNAYPNTGDGNFDLAKVLNSPAVPTVLFWNSRAPRQAITDAIDFAKYTQNDAVDGTAIQTNRLLAVQTKQMNLQNLLFGLDAIDMTKATNRSSLRDAVIQIPAGASGVSVNAAGVSGVNVLNAGCRPGTRLEVILAAGDATTGPVTAKVFGYEGDISPTEVNTARIS